MQSCSYKWISILGFISVSVCFGKPEYLVSTVSYILKPYPSTFKSLISKFKWSSSSSLGSKFRDRQANFGWYILVDGAGRSNSFKTSFYSTQYLEKTDGMHQDKQLGSLHDPCKGRTAGTSTSLLKKYHSWQKGKEDSELAGCEVDICIL